MEHYETKYQAVEKYNELIICDSECKCSLAVLYGSTLKMDAAGFSEMLVAIYKKRGVTIQTIPVFIYLLEA
jgi:hypothetical protein